MSALTDIRQGYVDALTAAGVAAYRYLPARFTPPCVLVQPGDPYLQPGDSFGSVQVTHDLILVVPGGENARQSDQLDALVETVVDAFPDDLTQVSGPSQLDAQGGSFLIVTATLTSTLIKE